MDREAADQSVLREMKSAIERAELARSASRALGRRSSSESRRRVCLHIASLLEDTCVRALILEANAADVRDAAKNGVSTALQARLKLSENKLDVLARGARQLASPSDTAEPLHAVRRRTALDEEGTLQLRQETVPLGVILVVFEARPDALVQIASLALRSGNALLLKGGREAYHSNAALFEHVVMRAIHQEFGKSSVEQGAVALLESREDVSAVLDSDPPLVDVVIPRGSSQLVRALQQRTRVPVLGHAEGICHVFVDESAKLDDARRLVIESKCAYPAACNAMETLLIHKRWPSNHVRDLLAALRYNGVELHIGPFARSSWMDNDKEELSIINEAMDSPLFIGESSAEKDEAFTTEYGRLACSVECVENVEAAIGLIARYGSSHTDCIVSEDRATNGSVERFIDTVDSACVMHNASTRFADGYRFGLGAEVGIATGRLHARGPMGLDGLTTTRWVLQSQHTHTVDQFERDDGTSPLYRHHALPLDHDLLPVNSSNNK